MLILMAVARKSAASGAMDRPLRLSAVISVLYLRTPQKSLVAPGFKVPLRKCSSVEFALSSKLSHEIRPTGHMQLPASNTSPSEPSPSSAEFQGSKFSSVVINGVA